MATLIVGARCKDGVVLVADRKQASRLTFELGMSTSKLVTVGPLVMGYCGTRAPLDKVRRLLGTRLQDVNSLDAALDLAESVATELQESYKELLGEEHLQFPLAGLERLTSGKAHLYTITAGFAPDEVHYGGWGIGERYSELGKLFFDAEQPVDEVSKVLPLLVALAERISLAIGDGLDVVIVRDEAGPKFLQNGETQVLLEKARNFVKDLKGIAEGRLLHTWVAKGEKSV